METGDPLLKSEVPPLSPCARSCALSPDGSMAAAGFDDGSLKVSNSFALLMVSPRTCTVHVRTYSTDQMQGIKRLHFERVYITFKTSDEQI